MRIWPIPKALGALLQTQSRAVGEQKTNARPFNGGRFLLCFSQKILHNIFHLKIFSIFPSSYLILPPSLTTPLSSLPLSPRAPPKYQKSPSLSESLKVTKKILKIRKKKSKRQKTYIHIHIHVNIYYMISKEASFTPSSVCQMRIISALFFKGGRDFSAPSPTS